MTREDIKRLLESIHTPVLDYLRSIDDQRLTRSIKTPWVTQQTLAKMIDHMIEHELHHCGELSLILGMLGPKGLNV